MWGRAMGGGPQLLPLLLLLPGAAALQCRACGGRGGTCRETTNVTCGPASDACEEALAAAAWSHGRFAIGWRGCGRGQEGANARALELFGLVVFVRRHQCRGGRGCNGVLPLGLEGALPAAGNASARVPNGVACYGCPDDGPCSSPTVVQCYDDLRGCFHGNVTLRRGGVTLWHEVRSCVRNESCSQEWRGDEAVGLSGSCCAGSLCNGPPPNKTFFAPDLPRLELLPHGHAPTAAPNATKMAAGTAAPNGSGSRAKMAATQGKMAATEAKMAATEGKMAATQSNMAATQAKMATTQSKMATTEGKMAATQSNMAATQAKMAAGVTGVTNEVTGGDKMAAGGDKMAAGRAASAGRRPLGGKDGVKGPVGRGHPIGGPGWLLPFLLLPLL